MRLDEAGQSSAIPELIARFPAWRGVIEDLTTLTDDPIAVRFYPSGCQTTEPIEADGGPYVVVVDGDLTTTQHMSLWTNDYLPGLILVTGTLRAHSLSYGNGAIIYVSGNVQLEKACFGQLGDHNAYLEVEGTLSASALFLDAATPVYAKGGIQALIYGADVYVGDDSRLLKPDIISTGEGQDERLFPPDLLKTSSNFPSRLHFPKALAAMLAGEPLFLPGVEESFPARLHLRST